MNRVWAHYFGRGLVETENDFGLQGTPPTHPELLDWLAAEFMEARLVAQAASSADSQLGHISPGVAAIAPIWPTVDPLNKLLGRQSRLRVDAEIVRDLGLSVSGLLSRQNWRAKRASAAAG